MIARTVALMSYLEEYKPSGNAEQEPNHSVNECVMLVVVIAVIVVFHFVNR
jgi:hypothetical protein